MENFFQTKWGSMLKAFLGMILAYMMANGGTLAALGLSAWLGALGVGVVALLIKWLTGETTGFFNTWYGGLLKTFILVSLGYIVEHQGFVGLNIGALLNAGIVAVITVIVNQSNPGDTRYGTVRA
jgi:hypothetical protein